MRGGDRVRPCERRVGTASAGAGWHGMHWHTDRAKLTRDCCCVCRSDGIGLPLSVYSDVNAVSSLCGTEVVVTSSTGQS